MDITFTDFLAAYTKASQNIKSLIDSEEIGLFVDTLLTESDAALPKPKLLVIISNRVLDLIPDSLMISQLEEVGLSQPDKIAQIKNFVITKTGTSNTLNIKSEIAEAEATMETISTISASVPKPPVNSIRTMASDSQVGYHSTEEKVHQSDQSHLFQK